MKSLILLLIFFVIVGCKERQISLSLPYEGDKLVLFSQIRANDTVQIEVQKTYPPTGKSTYIDGISDATVKLFGQDRFLELLKFTRKGIYVSSSGRKWQQGSKYKIEVNAPGFSLTTTEIETMPAKPVVAGYEFGRAIDSKFNSGIPSKELIINIEDNVNEENYYMIVVKRTVGKNTFGVNIFDLDKPNDFEDPCQFSYLSNIVLTDLCSVNGIITLKKGIEIRYPFDLDIDLTARDKIVVYTRQISKSYYEFCKSYYNEDDLVVAFKTPYPRHTNITGGYGIFSGFNEVEMEFVLKE